MGLAFEQIGCGQIYQCDRTSSLPIAVMPRCVMTGQDKMLCSFSLVPGMGINGFLPVLTQSQDSGQSWSEPEPIWPALQEAYSIYASVSAAPNGRLFLFGTQTPIDVPGESNWCDQTHGIKQNELVWATSRDGGQNWTAPAVIPLPIPGSAEAPGVICVTRKGTLLAPYSPYNTFDSTPIVQRNQVIAVRSTDNGQTWSHSAMLTFRQADSGGAEAWLVELTDGRLLGTSWHIDHSGREQNFPNAYALSLDEGRTWQPTRSTGILANTTVLAALPDGRAIFGYVQRSKDSAGIGLALVRPTKSDFGIQANEMIFSAETATQSGQVAEDNEWLDFSFGEPSITIMPDGTLFLSYWCIEPEFQGIKYIRLCLKQ